MEDLLHYALLLLAVIGASLSGYAVYSLLEFSNSLLKLSDIDKAINHLSRSFQTAIISIDEKTVLEVEIERLRSENARLSASNTELEESIRILSEAISR